MGSASRCSISRWALVTLLLTGCVTWLVILRLSGVRDGANGAAAPGPRAAPGIRDRLTAALRQQSAERYERQGSSKPGGASPGSDATGDGGSLDKSLDAGLERARAMKSPYFRRFAEAVSSGLALELMADPFARASGTSGAGGTGGERAGERSGVRNGFTRGEALLGGGADSRTSPGWEAAPSGNVPCLYKNGFDFIGEDVVTRMRLGRADCCALCTNMNKEDGPGSCKVAVLSSKDDDPPEACWVKKNVVRAVRKRGVTACIPAESAHELGLLLVKLQRGRGGDFRRFGKQRGHSGHYIPR